MLRKIFKWLWEPVSPRDFIILESAWRAESDDILKEKLKEFDKRRSA